MKKINIIYIILSVFVFTSCEDVIDVDLEQGETLLVVDGRITDEQKRHSIRLSTTAPYFDSIQTPIVSGAIVQLSVYNTSNQLISIDTLEEQIGTGIYLTDDMKGELNYKYALRIEALGEVYTAESILPRVPEIDSLTYEYKEAVGPFEAGYYVYFHGPETPGLGDNYLFRISRNGKEYKRPNQLYFATDELVDGSYIGNFDVTPEPFDLGDTIKVQNYTMSNDQYQFYLELSTQVNNGGIFASPPANVRTNIRNIHSNRKKAVGYFSANGTRSISVIIK